MTMNNFKVGGFKVFGEVVEFNMRAETKNTTYLKENLIETNVNNLISKNLKSSIVYGGNNTGKSSLLEAIITMKKVVQKGDLDGFPFDEFKNFCYKHDDLIKFEMDFNNLKDNYVYGIEFTDENAIGEYLYLNDLLLFSRDLEGKLEGALLKTIKGFSSALDNLSLNKLIIPYFLEYQKNIKDYLNFKIVKEFFNKIKFIDNRRNIYNIKLLLEFMETNKLNVLNELIKSTELYLEGRKILNDEELFNSKLYKELTKSKGFDELSEKDDNKDDLRNLIETLKITSIYKGKKGKLISKPSLLFDSVGTNKFLNLSMNIINALINGNILLIDEFDSSLHHKLTRILVILMNSEANKNSQFILTTHDVNLLSNELFRKDQINFILRTEKEVDIISLDSFKANSEKDIRNTTNFEKMYIEEKIIPLPSTDIHRVIKAITNE